MSWGDIVGQDRAVGFLRRTVSGKRRSHAYLFTGPEGVGKKLAAVNFAKALNCAGSDGALPCDSCISCRKIESLNHPDVSIIMPDKDKSSIGIDKVRAMMRDVSFKTYEGKVKVYIIDGAHLMKHEAQNAMLKTLEEPPTDSVVDLVTDLPGQLFGTILSRVQKVTFFPLDTGSIAALLAARYGADANDARIIAKISGGSLGRAIMFHQKDFLKERTRILEGLESGALFDSEFDGAARKDMGQYLDLMLLWYRDMLLAKIGSPEETFANSDMARGILRHADRASFGQIEDAIERIIETGAALGQNANPKLAMAALGMGMN